MAQVVTVTPQRDARRDPACHLGALVYSARVNNANVSCWYKMQFCCCMPEQALSRTYLDVHTNAIVANTPLPFCCCLYCDRATTAFFDRPLFSQPAVAAGICEPFPWICHHGCGFCGDTLALRGPTIGGPTPFVGHCMACYCLLCIPMCPVNWFTGLEQGEAPILASVINNSVQQYRLGGGRYQAVPLIGETAPGAVGVPVAAAPPAPMGMDGAYKTM